MDHYPDYLLNISQLEEAFKISRPTIRKRLKQAGVLPAGRKGNSPVYHISTAAKSVFTPAPGMDGDYGGYDSPDKMPPRDRKDWFDSERSKMAAEKEANKLVPVGDVAMGYADFIKAIINPLDSLPDLLERKCGLSGEAVERVQAVIDSVREQMYLRAIQSGAELDGDND